MLNIEKAVEEVRRNITQSKTTTLYKGQDMGARYATSSNSPDSGAQGLSAAVTRAFEMDGYATRVLIADNYSSSFNAKHGLTENQIVVLP